MMTEVQTKKTDELSANEERQGLASLAAPLLTFSLMTEIERLRQQEHWLRDGRISKTLVKHSDLRVVLILMRAGALIKQHKADAAVSIHALSGRLLVQVHNKRVELSAGCLLVIDKCLPHDVNAVEDSAFLLSISWLHGNDQSSYDRSNAGTGIAIHPGEHPGPERENGQTRTNRDPSERLG